MILPSSKSPLLSKGDFENRHSWSFYFVEISFQFTANMTKQLYYTQKRYENFQLWAVVKKIYVFKIVSLLVMKDKVHVFQRTNIYSVPFQALKLYFRETWKHSLQFSSRPVDLWLILFDYLKYFWGEVKVFNTN